jgi:hypothetical protein
LQFFHFQLITNIDKSQLNVAQGVQLSLNLPDFEFADNAEQSE